MASKSCALLTHSEGQVDQDRPHLSSQSKERSLQMRWLKTSRRDKELHHITLSL
jgi:hypothetical protein